MQYFAAVFDVVSFNFNTRYCGVSIFCQIDLSVFHCRDRSVQKDANSNNVGSLRRENFFSTLNLDPYISWLHLSNSDLFLKRKMREQAKQGSDEV